MKRSWLTVTAIIVSLISGTIAGTCFADNHNFQRGSNNGSRNSGGSNSLRFGGNVQSLSGSGMNRTISMPKTFQQSSNNFSQLSRGSLQQGGFQNKIHLPANNTVVKKNSGLGITLGKVNGGLHNSVQNHGPIKTLPKFGNTLPIVSNNGVNGGIKHTLPLIPGNVKNGNSPIKTMPFPIVGNNNGNGNGNGNKGLGIKIGIGNGNGNGQGLGLGITLGNNHNHNHNGNAHCHKPGKHCWINWGGCYKPCQPVHYCPPKYCGPVYVWPVCTGPVVIEVPVPVDVVPVMQVPMGATISLEDANLGPDMGQVMLQIDKVSVPAQVDAWSTTGLTTTLPMLGLSAPTRAQLWLIRADGNVANSLTIELLPATDVQVSSTAITSVEALGLEALK